MPINSMASLRYEIIESIQLTWKLLSTSITEFDNLYQRNYRDYTGITELICESAPAGVVQLYLFIGNRENEDVLASAILCKLE